MLLVVAGACGRARYSPAIDAGAASMDASVDDASVDDASAADASAADASVDDASAADARAIDAAPIDAVVPDAVNPDAPSRDAPVDVPSADASDAGDAASDDASASDAPVPAADADGPLADCFLSAACAVLCQIDPVAGTSDCGPPVSGLAWSGPGRGTATIDMSGFTTLDLEVSACDPSGWSFVLADSPATDGFGGDSGLFSNDAELEIWSRRALLNFSDDRPMPGPTSREIGRVLSATGCSTHVISVSDGRVSECAGGEYVGMDSLRIDPPIDREGPPDALWYLGIQQTMSGRVDRVGTGMTRLRLCFR